jgi:hypothetical protein
MPDFWGSIFSKRACPVVVDFPSEDFLSQKTARMETAKIPDQRV